ncbi:MAG: DUF3473 domain-containing protein [Candidatus Omnitrophica bacterium]|nr:DUF3473 domain-containing protein [Candidatus Omnitrophota bacterium]
MKILHIISSSGYFGAESVMLDLLTLLKKKGDAPFLACLKNVHKSNPEVFHRAIEKNIPARVITCRRRFDPSAIRKLVNLVKKEKMQIIHTHGYKGSFYGLIVSKIAKVPIVTTLHGWTGEDRKVRFYDWLDKRLLKRMDHVVSVSPQIYQHVQKMVINNGKVSFVPNSVDMDRFNPNTRERDIRKEFGLGKAFVIGAVGRLSVEKGHKYLLEAFRRICNVQQNVKLLIVGDGEENAYLKQRAREMRMEDNVVFAGFQKEMVPIYKSMDIFVLPSLKEGIPISLLEAMSMKVPVIASDVGGVSYVISNDDGILVRPRSSDELKEAIFTLMNKKGLRDKLTRNAYNNVKRRFSQSQFYRNYKKIYEAMVHKSTGAQEHRGTIHRPSADVANILTIDVEDYFQVENFKKVIASYDWDRIESRVVKNTEKILEILDRHKTKATFFVLGWIAERFPELVKRIHEGGHEIASHGYSHNLIYGDTIDAFEEDLRKARHILENITGEPVLGYRAPSYSITKDSLWALDVLKDKNYVYDSSIFPIYHDRGGLVKAPRYPYRVEIASPRSLGARNDVLKIARNDEEGGLWEFPLSTAKILGRNLPFSGGGYFRLLPYGIVKRSIKRINNERQPAVIYLHPWEFDPEQPRIKADAVSKFRHYVNLSKTESKLESLLRDFKFTSIREYLRSVLGERFTVNEERTVNDLRLTVNGKEEVASSSRNFGTPRNDKGIKMAKRGYPKDLYDDFSMELWRSYV